MKRTAVFAAYSGEVTNELLSYPARGQCDLLVRAFEEGLQWKVSRTGERALSKEERIVLAVRALDREVNNGGYDQFFRNSSKKFASEIVHSFVRIGCRRTAKITQRAINAVRSGSLTVSRIDATMPETNERRDVMKCFTELHKEYRAACTHSSRKTVGASDCSCPKQMSHALTAHRP